MIAILTPTRGRPTEAFEMLDTFVERQDDCIHNRYLFYVDDDDPKLDEYRDLIQDCFLPNVTFIIGPPIGVGKAWNRLCRQALDDDNVDAVMMGNDDLRMVTDGWDRLFRTAMSVDYEDPSMYCAFFDDAINSGKHCAFPIVPRAWVEKIGQFTPECFRFFYHDTWIFDVARELGVDMYIPSVRMRHEHFSKGGIADETTNHNRRDGQHRDDTRTFAEGKRERMQWAERLKR